MNKTLLLAGLLAVNTAQMTQATSTGPGPARLETQTMKRMASDKNDPNVLYFETNNYLKNDPKILKVTFNRPNVPADTTDDNAIYHKITKPDATHFRINMHGQVAFVGSINEGSADKNAYEDDQHVNVKEITAIPKSATGFKKLNRENRY